MNQQILKWIMEMQAIAQNGLAYSKEVFDLERYRQLMSLAKTMAEHYSHAGAEDIAEAFDMQHGYATPKVGVRAVIIKDRDILLTKERQDNLWTLPGGWADVAVSPAENVVKEVKEETGYDVEVVRLLALWDKLKHDHPLQWPHAYQCFFQCNIIGGAACETIETSGVSWFSIDALPALSTPRVTEAQIKKLYEIIRENVTTAYD